jgi:hypothetical protein
MNSHHSISTNHSQLCHSPARGFITCLTQSLHYNHCLTNQLLHWNAEPLFICGVKDLIWQLLHVALALLIPDALDWFY